MPPRNPGDQPLHRLIADHLLRLIQREEIRPGQQMPSAADVAKEWETSTPTARKAYAWLINNGHVVSREREGYFARRIDETTWLRAQPTGPVDPWLAALDAGRNGTQIIKVEMPRTDHRIGATTVGDALGLTPGDRVVCRSIIRMIDGAPRELADFYLPYREVKDSAVMDPADTQPNPLPTMAELGHTLAGFEDRLVGRPPTDKEMALLELDPGTWVMQTVRRFRFGPDGRCLMVCHSVCSALGAEFVYAGGA